MAGVQQLGRVHLSCVDFFDIHGCYAAKKSRGLLGEVTALEIPCENASLHSARDARGRKHVRSTAIPLSCRYTCDARYSPKDWSRPARRRAAAALAALRSKNRMRQGHLEQDPATRGLRHHASRQSGWSHLRSNFPIGALRSQFLAVLNLWPGTWVMLPSARE